MVVPGTSNTHLGLFQTAILFNPCSGISSSSDEKDWKQRWSAPKNEHVTSPCSSNGSSDHLDFSCGNNTIDRFVYAVLPLTVYLNQDNRSLIYGVSHKSLPPLKSGLGSYFSLSLLFFGSVLSTINRTFPWTVKFLWQVTLIWYHKNEFETEKSFKVLYPLPAVGMHIVLPHFHSNLAIPNGVFFVTYDDVQRRHQSMLLASDSFMLSHLIVCSKNVTSTYISGCWKRR